MSEPRKTRKSRIVDQIADAITTLVINGNHSPSKKKIVEAIVDSSLSDAASAAVRSMLEDEVANSLDNYFMESCSAAAVAMGIGQVPAAFHYVTTTYYEKRCPVPQSETEARQYVVCFGNGRTGKAAGVRYPTADDEPDAMLLIHLQKSIETIRAAINTHHTKAMNQLQSPALGSEVRDLLIPRVPPLLITA